MSQNSTTTETLLDRIAVYDGHLVFASRTGSGKTTLLLASIAHKTKQAKGAIEWLCASGKASVWMGLEHQIGKDGQPRILNASLSNPASIEPVLKRLRFAVKTQEAREITRIDRTQQGNPPSFKPIYLVLDEWPVLLKVAKRRSKEAYQELIDLVETIVFKGREDRVFVWIAAQGHHCGTLHLDGDLRTNLGVIALGGGGNNQSVSSAITDPYLVEVDSERKRLEQSYQALTTEEPSGRLFYTSIGGHQLGRTLSLPKMEQQQIFQPDSPSPIPHPPSAPPSPLSDADRLERAYQKSPAPTPKPTEQETLLRAQLAIERQKLKVAAKVAKTDYQRATVEAYGDTVKAEDRWNLATLSYGLLVCLIYVVPPLSGAVQAAWKAPGAANLAITQATEQGGEAIAPALSKPPAVGDKINGYEVKAIAGNTITIALNDGALYPIGKEPVEVKCEGDKLTYSIGAAQFAYEPLNNCAGGKQSIGQTIGKSKNVLGTENTIKISRSDVVPTQADLWQALTGSAPEPALNRVNVTSRGKQISEKALAWAGKPFNPGEKAQCAMFVRQVLKDAGVNAGVTQKAVDGQSASEAIANSFFGEDLGEIVRDVNQLQPGDLIAYGGTYGGYPVSTITHVAVYVGNGEMVDRGTSDRDVTKRSISTFPHFVAGVRLK